MFAILRGKEPERTNKHDGQDDEHNNNPLDHFLGLRFLLGFAAGLLQFFFLLVHSYFYFDDWDYSGMIGIFWDSVGNVFLFYSSSATGNSMR